VIRACWQFLDADPAEGDDGGKRLASVHLRARNASCSNRMVRLDLPVLVSVTVPGDSELLWHPKRGDQQSRSCQTGAGCRTTCGLLVAPVLRLRLQGVCAELSGGNLLVHCSIGVKSIFKEVDEKPVPNCRFFVCCGCSGLGSESPLYQPVTLRVPQAAFGDPQVSGRVVFNCGVLSAG
jgi:hypothetical protein